MKIAGITSWGSDKAQKAQTIKENAHSYDKFVVYGQTECEVHNTPGFIDLLEAAQSQNKKLIAISGASKFLTPLPFQDKVIYELNQGGYYFWLAFNQLYLNYDAVANYVKDYDNNQFKYPFITLNRVSWPHRCEMIDLVYKNNLFDRNCIGWHEPKPIMPYRFRYWTPKKLSLDDNFYAHQDAVYRLPKVYFECFAQLISESTEKALFLTEKTALALFLKKPFLVATAPGYHKFLTELGFKLYDEIFDYSFDSMQVRLTRYNTMLQNFVKLDKLHISELSYLHKSIADKLEFNRKRAIEIARNLLLFTPTLNQTIIFQKADGVKIDHNSFNELNAWFPTAEENYKKLHNE